MPLQGWADMAKEAGDTEIKAVPAGDYDLKIVKSEATRTGGGKTMFKITTEIQSGPHKKRRIWTNLVVSPENPQALNIFFRQIAAIGIDKSFFATDPSDPQVAKALENREFRAQVIIKNWQGTDRNEIKSYSKTSNTGASPAAVPMATPAASPANTAPAPAGYTPAAAPQAPPPAAAAATPQSAPAPAPEERAPEPVVASTPPPVTEPVTPAPAPSQAPAPSEAPAPPF